MQERLRTEATASMAQATGGANTFGDQQLAADIFAERTLMAALQGKCAVFSSEESPEEVTMGGSSLCVVSDPLDGSSILGANLTVGTIFGVFPGRALVGCTGRDCLAAGYALYGPRTELAVAVQEAPGVPSSC